MTTQAQPLTFEQVVAETAETLSYLLDQDVTTLTPDDLVEALEDAGSGFSSSFEQTNQANGDAMTAAAVLLTEALVLDADNPDVQVLLRRAQARLRDTEI
ncbi:hypothetical protein [Streptomyces sp. NPDC002913]